MLHFFHDILHILSIININGLLQNRNSPFTSFYFVHLLFFFFWFRTAIAETVNKKIAANAEVSILSSS